MKCSLSALHAVTKGQRPQLRPWGGCSGVIRQLIRLLRSIACWMASSTFRRHCFGSSSNSGKSSTQLCRSVKRMVFGSMSGGLRQLNGNFQYVNPFHGQCDSLAWLMVYLGISITRSSSATIAWHDRRRSAPGPRPCPAGLLPSPRLRSASRAFAHHHVAGGAGAGFFAGMFDFDIVLPAVRRRCSRRCRPRSRRHRGIIADG